MVCDTERVAIYERPPTGPNPHDRHSQSVQSGLRRSDGKRSGRFRTTRNKAFLNRLRKAKEEEKLIKVKDIVVDLEVEQHTFGDKLISTVHCEYWQKPFLSVLGLLKK